MEFKESQKDMNTAYIGGATGVLASGFVWCIAGLVGLTVSNNASMAALFIGGTLIFPLSTLFSKILRHSGTHSSNNALRHLAIENLGILFAGLYIAFYVAQFNIALFFPIMLLVIGARYLMFHTLYGLKSYWALGVLLMMAGMLCSLFNLPFIVGAFIGGIIEILFSLVIFKQAKPPASGRSSVSK